MRDTCTTLTQVFDQVRNVSTLIGEISAASHEQTRVITQLSTPLSRLDRAERA